MHLKQEIYCENTTSADNQDECLTPSFARVLQRPGGIDDIREFLEISAEVWSRLAVNNVFPKDLLDIMDISGSFKAVRAFCYWLPFYLEDPGFKASQLLRVAKHLNSESSLRLLGLCNILIVLHGFTKEELIEIAAQDTAGPALQALINLNDYLSFQIMPLSEIGRKIIVNLLANPKTLGVFLELANNPTSWAAYLSIEELRQNTSTTDRITKHPSVPPMKFSSQQQPFTFFASHAVAPSKTNDGSSPLELNQNATKKNEETRITFDVLNFLC